MMPPGFATGGASGLEVPGRGILGVPVRQPRSAASLVPEVRASRQLEAGPPESQSALEPRRGQRLDRRRSRHTGGGAWPANADAAAATTAAPVVR